MKSFRSAVCAGIYFQNSHFLNIYCPSLYYRAIRLLTIFCFLRVFFAYKISCVSEYRHLTLWRLTTYIYICISRTAQLTSRRCILDIYSTDILTEYFKNAAHYQFFLSSRCRLFHNAIFFGSCNIHILYTGCAKTLKKIPRAKWLIDCTRNWQKSQI